METLSRPDGPVRYAVVGLGHIAQAAVLPAFRHAKENCALTALVSRDVEKRKALAKKYRVPHTFSYEEYDACLRSDDVDAVYIALPNHMHCEYAVRAAEAGKHVLCEKPMATDESECHKMIEAADSSNVRLMIAYRLHFEKANLEAIELARAGTLGDLRYFSSTFSMQVRDENIRTQVRKGGGTLYDIGIYCINAARYLFRSEPTEVCAWTANNGEPRFSEIDEMATSILRFPGERLATFTTSFGASDADSYRLVGTKGDLRMDPAYGYTDKLRYELTVDGKTSKRVFPRHDQFAAELTYFAECVLSGKRPEPSGVEGLIDVRIIEALYRSAQEKRPIAIEPVRKSEYPSRAQEIDIPPVSEPEVIHAESPHY